MTKTHVSGRLLPAASLLLAASCSGTKTPSEPPPAPTSSVHPHTTATPTATVATTVAPAPAVIVRDAAGEPISGAQVTFSIIAAAAL